MTDEGYDPSVVGIESEGSIAAVAYIECYGTDGLVLTCELGAEEAFSNAGEQIRALIEGEE